MKKFRMLGDSLTAGAGASSVELSYSYVFCQMRGYERVRNAESGRTLQKISTDNTENSLENLFFTPTAQQLQNEPQSVFSDAWAGVSCFIGINDVFGKDIGGTPSSFRSMYDQVLDQLLTTYLVPADKLTIINIGRYRSDDNPTNDYVQELNMQISQMIGAYGLRLVNNYQLDDDYGTDPLYVQPNGDNDRTHKNDLGHRLLAELMDSVIPKDNIPPSQIMVPYGNFIVL